MRSLALLRGRKPGLLRTGHGWVKDSRDTYGGAPSYPASYATPKVSWHASAPVSPANLPRVQIACWLRVHEGLIARCCIAEGAASVPARATLAHLPPTKDSLPSSKAELPAKRRAGGGPGSHHAPDKGTRSCLRGGGLPRSPAKGRLAGAGPPQDPRVARNSRLHRAGRLPCVRRGRAHACAHRRR